MKSLGTVTLYTTGRLIEVCLLLKGKVNCFSLWQINFNEISAVTRKLFQPLCNYAVVTASLGVRPSVYQKKEKQKENQYIGSQLCKNINSEIKPIRINR